MDNIRVYLDEGSLLGVTDAASGNLIFEELRSILRDLLSAKILIFSYDVFSMLTGIHGGSPLYEWIYGEPELAGLDQSDVRDIVVLLQRCSDWEDIVDGLPVLRWQDDRSEAGSIANAHAWSDSDERELPGLISIGNKRFDDVCTLAEDGGREKKVFILGEGSDVILYFRAIMRMTRHYDDIFASISSLAFPSLILANDLRPTSLGVDLDVHMQDVVVHLTFLSDRYCIIGSELGWDLPRMCRAAAALGIDLSDESANTKANAHAMRQRRASVLINGTSQTYVCSLHTKIEPTRGRIHFYVERLEDGHRVIIGLFERHLDT